MAFDVPTNMTAILFNGELALKQFKKRKKANSKQAQVDNSSLPAGSPMTYYCKYCGDKTAVLPEEHVETAPTVCKACEALAIHGLI